MHRRLKFGMRENPASDGRHGSRQAICALSEANLSEKEIATSPLGQNQLFAGAHRKLNGALTRAATAGKEDVTVTRPTVPAPTAAQAPVPIDFEPLIGSCEAARLLGNIHVKTLQRYARHARIPGYQIGGHWYFRASELDYWLRSQINFSCHPCRSK